MEEPLNFENLVDFEEGLFTENQENRKSDSSILPILPFFQTFFFCARDAVLEESRIRGKMKGGDL